MGLCAPFDLAIGIIMPGSYCREGTRGRKTDYRDTIVQIPTKLQVVHTLIADDVWVGIHPELHLYRACPMEPEEDLEERWYDRLGQLETLEYLGRGLGSVYLPECRNYLEMLTQGLPEAEPRPGPLPQLPRPHAISCTIFTSSRRSTSAAARNSCF